MKVEDLRYNENHTWVGQKDKELVIGITDYAQDQMGDIIFAELPEEGSVIAAGDPFATLESAKAVQDVIAPVGGEVVRVNEELMDAPEIINDDPYSTGWMIAVKADAGALDLLLTYEEYTEMLEHTGD